MTRVAWYVGSRSVSGLLTLISMLTLTLALAPCAATAAQPSEAVIGMQLEPPLLDPTASPAAAIAESLYGNVYEGLVQFSANGTAVPCLALSWDVSDDGLVYLFHLRSGVRFHDAARFDASVAKFSLERAIAADSVNPQKSRLAAIKSIEAVDATTLRLVLTRRAGGLIQSLAWSAFVMVAPGSAADNAHHPVGTGPFRFEAWRRGDSLTLVRNADYWGTPPALQRATFKFISDPSAAYAALMAGDVDAFSNYPAPESVRQFQRDRRFTVSTGTSEGEVIVSFNERHAPLDDVRVRRALSFAIDRAALVDGATFGFGVPIGSHFPPHSPAYVDLTGVYPHDVAKARKLLAAAGYGQGFNLSLKLPPPSYARRSGEIIAAQFAQAGVHVTIENLEWAQWLDQVFARHDFDMSIVAHAEPEDYDIYARDDYYFGYSSPQFKALLARLEDTVEAAQRTQVLQQIQRQLADDAVNGFLFQQPILAVSDAHLVGIPFGNSLSLVYLKDAHYDGPRAAGERSQAREPRSFSALAGVLALAALALFVIAGRRMGAVYVTQRVAILLTTLLAASAIVFIIVQIVPGDPVRYMMGVSGDAGTLETLRHQLGLDATPLQRYVRWVTGLAHGNFGESYTYRVPVGALIAERLQVSLPLALYSLLWASVIALPIGLLAAAWRHRAGDAVLTGMTQLGLAIPNFWLGLLLVLVFAVGLRWTSAGGFPGWNMGFWPAIRALTLPALALAMPQAAILARVLRSALIATLHEDYIRTARAKGASDAYVLVRHAFPNALIPVLTILGLQFSFLLAGGVIIENVFFLPGLGRLVFQSIVQRDLIVVQSVVIVLVFAVVAVTFLVDLSYVLVNPRLRTGTR